MHEILLVRDGATPRMLADAALKVFRALKIETAEERQSTNYVDGFYFIGYAANVAVKVCYSDSAEMLDYPYWVVLVSPVRRRDFTVGIDSNPEAVASALTHAGLDVFIPSPGFGHIDWNQQGTHYRAK
jgi:hypothetical protein